MLKKTTTVVLPAASTLYFALAQIWHLPKAEEVIGTIAAVNTFLGALLHVSTVSYNKSDTKYAGVVQVQDQPDKKVLIFSLNDKSKPIEHQNEVTFKVDTDTGETPIVDPEADPIR
jgi:hypothetical protein